MNSKLYVGNLSFQTSEESLENIFKTVGEVISTKIITDMYTGKSKGFGFVEMSNKNEATIAIETLNGKEFDGRNLKIDFVREQPREDRGRSSYERRN